MVSIIHQLGNTEKLDAILAAAQKRFGHYGFEKTTMSEIAADVNMSKASLYYYFPDKESLWWAVLAKEQNEYFALVSANMSELRDPEKMLYEFVRLRHGYFTTFLNLTKFRFSDFYQIRPHLREMIDQLLSREAGQITAILKQGTVSGAFEIENHEQTARLFLDILHGLRMIVIRNRPMMEIKQEDYDLMFEKQRNFIELFIRSIRSHKGL
ncbi:MAG: TetR/AcrR family transcriptional regulator [Bacteroidota bacterium]